MKRTTVFLEDRLLRSAQRAARQKGVSFAMLVREALTRYLAEPVAQVPSIAGRFSSDDSETAIRVDERLWHNPHE